jgi:sterol desaturase/sphingolipid hydroxylase (fatty acid hydroxylase superfamily)
MHRYGHAYLFIVPLFFAVALGEAVFLNLRRGHYDWKAFAVSFADRAGHFALRTLLPFGIAVPLLGFAYGHRLFHFQLQAAWQIAALYLGQELCYYWFHRSAHRVRWFWASHVVHHSPNELNFSAAYRLGLTGRLTGNTIFYVPLAWLGFDPRIVLGVLGANLLYQFWIHADWIPKLGWLEYVLNTPSHHRVHHSRQVEYLDANYGGTLIVFDRLFGTFVEEREDVPVQYGLVKPVTTYNPFVIEFQGWTGMLRDVLRAGSLKDAFGYVFGPPGWAPDGKGETTEDLRRGAPSVAAEAG